MSGTPPRFFRAAPLLGEQTEEILQRLGYGVEAIKELRENGVV
jgi:crotonobetainyl-CoA:carnitine CoA-transferase CaiB-like acyl-CoA transferase